MTSKNCCFKLMREDAKRRLWLISLLALMFAFLYPVAVTSILGDYVANVADPSRSWTILLTTISAYYSKNDMVVFCMVISAVICGISSFSYLCSKKQVDFYHAIPVKRETLFCAQYFNGILIVVLLYSISVLASLLIVAVNGAFTWKLLQQAVTFLLANLSFYILLYSTVVAAVMMTGNLIISILATGVFFFYGPAVLGLVNGYFDIFLQTFYNGNSWDSLFKISSPFAYYVFSVEHFSDGKIWFLAATALAAACAITILSVWMYKKRPSESAGKAMAFEKTKTAIKILLVIPISMAGCILFWNIHYSVGWSLFGLLVGGILSHCIFEIIYNFDFRRLFANKLHLLVCLLASVLLFFGFKYDIAGYDKYVPEKEDLQSMAISINRLDDWITYGSLAEDVDSSYWSETVHYNWQYQSGADYVFENMELEQVEPALEVIKTAMAPRDYESQGSSERAYTSYSYWIDVQYKLKSGRKVCRTVMLPNDELDKLSTVYADPQYKMGTFPLLNQAIDNTAAVAYQEMSHITKLPLENKADIEALLLAYQEELKLLSFETKREEQPIGMIQFRTPELETAINQSDGRYSDISQRTYYPVYPSFQKTIKLLEAVGIYPGTKLKLERISKITVVDRYYRDKYQKDIAVAEPVSLEKTIIDTEHAGEAAITKISDSSGNIRYEFTGQKNIEHLYPCLVSRDYADLNTLNPYDEYMEVTVEYGEGMETFSYRFVLIPERLPEDLKALFDYDNKDLS